MTSIIIITLIVCIASAFLGLMLRTRENKNLAIQSVPDTTGFVTVLYTVNPQSQTKRTVEVVRDFDDCYTTLTRFDDIDDQTLDADTKDIVNQIVTTTIFQLNQMCKLCQRFPGSNMYQYRFVRQELDPVLLTSDRIPSAIRRLETSYVISQDILNGKIHNNDSIAISWLLDVETKAHEPYIMTISAIITFTIP